MKSSQDRTLSLGRYAAEVGRHPLLSRDEELRLARQYKKDGDPEAAQRLTVSNLRFVIRMAYDYEGYGLCVLDLVQEGAIGLMMAVKKFDPERGYRLVSYAVWWIRAYMKNYVLRSWSTVKLGTTRAQRKLFFRLRRERRALEGPNGEPVSSSFLAERLGVALPEIAAMEARLALRDFALDAPVADSAQLTHLDLLEDDREPLESALFREETRARVRTLLERQMHAFNDKELSILGRRLLASDPQTLSAIGKRLGISRERVRQIEAALLDKLRGQFVGEESGYAA